MKTQYQSTRAIIKMLNDRFTDLTRSSNLVIFCVATASRDFKFD
ncbi:hypothetical protein CAMRE0001_0341 [Campylobacter rectus RM3267]|uniref:Uncharacterized protein n=1 Tax=Campylobacter rectus RM3267 TaxID=553218 RepID=B9D2B6_CAMRE|nr:hypothetical protein CAMRE0001_0341 [Campylobacter rectus RM3267]